MKRLLLPFCLLMTSMTFAQNSLNVMTYNIRLDVASDSLNNWQYRKDNLVSEVVFYEADVLGIQEALEGQMKDLQQKLPQFGSVGESRDSSKWGEYNAIFYRKDRLQMIEQNTFWLSPHIRKKWAKGWDAALPRIVSWAKLKDLKTKKVFYFFNTHFDHMGQEARRQSAHLLLKQIAAIAGNLPVIVTGDFNATINDEPIQILVNPADSLHLTDSKEVSSTPHFGPGGSFNGFEQKERDDFPIDFIFVRNGVKVSKHATLSPTWKGRFASDHFAIFAKVTIGEQ